ncbi:MAG: hypothetical protein IH935_09115 [Acidobacteria bacterium]|nr:hypothetical protein [Acidobacteriota bacterium]
MGTLTKDSSATVRIVVTPTATGEITNTGTVSHDGTDPNAANDTATLVTAVVNPVPFLSAISPGSTETGGTEFTLTLSGLRFVSESVVRWNGEERVTTFVSSTELEASIPASDIAVAGTAEVTVFNPLPGGGSSNVVVFNVLVFNPEGSCVNIAGVWEVEESATLACTLSAFGESESFTDPLNASRSVTIFQEPGACSFSYDPGNIGDGSLIQYVRTEVNGNIDGDRIITSGGNLLPAPDAQLIETSFGASGQVSGNEMTLSGSGPFEINQIAPEGGFTTNLSCTFTSTAVFTSSAPPPPLTTPTLPPNSVVNGASFRPATDLGGALAPGSIVAIFGNNLADDLQLATAVPLPTTLGNTSVTFNGISAPLFFVSPTQINAQVPFDVLPGEVSVQVKRGSETSASQTVSVAAVSPGIFALNQQGTGQGAVLIANTAIFAAPSGSIPGREARPANRLEFISIFAVGLGPLQSPATSGDIPPTPPPQTTSQPQVNIAGIPGEVTYSGLAPGFVGLYQVNVQVPAGVPSGTQNLEIIINGVPSNTITIAVQ